MRVVVSARIVDGQSARAARVRVVDVDEATNALEFAVAAHGHALAAAESIHVQAAASRLHVDRREAGATAAGLNPGCATARDGAEVAGVDNVPCVTTRPGHDVQVGNAAAARRRRSPGDAAGDRPVSWPLFTVTVWLAVSRWSSTSTEADPPVSVTLTGAAINTALPLPMLI